MKRVDFGKLSLTYNDEHDISAILEVIVLDVYGIRRIRKGDTILDLGAGIGEFTVLTSKKVGRAGLVLSIEPNSLDFQVMTQNLATNSCENVIVFNSAISSTKGKISLEFKRRTFTAETISQNEITNCLTEHHRSKLDVVKIDIEGGEIEALSILKDYLTLTRFIMIEMHGTKNEVDKILEPFGFSFRRIKRVDYISSALFSLLRHPVSSIRLWRAFYSTEENPGIKKILKGIEIARSDNLVVGVYEKREIK